MLACDAELTGLTMVLRIVQEAIKQRNENQQNSENFPQNNRSRSKLRGLQFASRSGRGASGSSSVFAFAAWEAA